jgi:hypothetical protein
LQSTRALCALRSIINFKSEMIDPNRSIQSISKPNFISFGIHLLFFWIGVKSSFLDEPEFSDQIIFLLTRKNSKKNLKNINFGLLIDFDMKIRLNGSDRSFLT